MERVRLTNERINSFKCPPGKSQAFLWDTETPCLAVRSTSSGAKSFIFESKLRRQTIRITIGDVRHWTLNSVWSGKGENKVEVQRGAREEATNLKMLVNQGIDPRQAKADQIAIAEARATQEAARQNAEAEAQRRTEITVADAWSKYIIYQKARMDRGGEKCWGERHLLDHEKLAQSGGIKKQIGKGITEPGPLSSLMPMKLSGLTSDALAHWLQDETAKRPARAALAFRLFRAFLRWCATDIRYSSLVSLDAINAKTVRDEVPRTKPKNEDCLQREQLAAWFLEVRKLSSQTISAYLQALVLTGARREELAGLKWSDVDLQWKSLTIRDKVEGERIIPLTPYVESLLLDLKRRNETPPPEYRISMGKRIKNDLEHWKPAEWVFVGASKTGRMVEPSPAHKRVLQAAGLPSLTLHGLRRSFGTLAEWTETPVGVVAQIQGHKPSALAEKHYRRRPLDLLRSWHTKIEEWILEQAGIEPLKNDATRTLKTVTG
ncbi:tyrosine-type recombinase/integrase [Propionivibrio dicarboxylicus]|uniref:Tyr recombinase domain-containing protein n=1 Tax=Propionivibrio dicarboxylicus TaxID=83767 RepID=A0A1G8FVE2_9RHOO|nr:tyrosine-type recombinase/integrase [Propionivibrio dicarboxylicus]SDH86075.1 protein of unknown function [Propionivibrio dicarboxylicus]